MAKVSVAVEAHRAAGLPFISLLTDPTFGGVSASYAMQSDVRIAAGNDCRIGFAGPTVILNTMCGGDQVQYDADCPADFQSAGFVKDKGQVDMVIDAPADSEEVLSTIGQVCYTLTTTTTTTNTTTATTTDATSNHTLNYTRSRTITRPQAQDFISNLLDTSSYIELSGDGRVGSDICMKGGIGLFNR